MKKIAAIALMALALAGCTREDQARNTLTGAGFKDIKITGYYFFGCSKDDTFHTGFTARSPSGQFVEGVVCSAVFKGATIRTY